MVRHEAHKFERMVKRKPSEGIEDRFHKRIKTSEGWFPGKYVMAPRAESDEHSEKSNEKKTNGNVNGKDIVSKKQLDNDSLSDNSENCADYTSTDDEEEVGKEWSTDTDYTEEASSSDDDSFHESEWRNPWMDDDSSDCTYQPEIEDLYIKRGNAIIYDAKGLDQAFGDSNKSQIIEVADIQQEIEKLSNDSEEEIPQLVANDACDENMEVDENLESLSASLQFDSLNVDEDEMSLSGSQLSKCASFYDCIDGGSVIVKLSGTVHFHGILIIKAIINSVQINGFILHPGEIINATSISRADYFLNLTPFIDETNYDAVKLQEDLKGILPDGTILNITNTFNPNIDILLLLQKGLPSVQVEILKNYLPNAILPHKKFILKNSNCPTSEIALLTKFFVANDNPKVKCFEINSNWAEVEIKPTTRLVLVGGKNVGKSGISQYLINKNIATYPKILLIDLDIGQPICSLSQTISASIISEPILGAGYLSKNIPIKCLLYGDKSIMISPFKYVRCVQQLVEFCMSKPDCKEIPWVINTMGYQKGFGLQLMCLLLKILQPSDVIQVQHRNPSYNFSKILTDEFINEFKHNFFDEADAAGLPSEVFFVTHVLDSIVNNNDDINATWISNATEKRKMSMLAHLAKLLKVNQTCLNDVTPFNASLNEIRMVIMDEEYSQQSLNLDLFNGNLVYLCHTDDGTATDCSSIFVCLGIGIVRGIDNINERMYILLPQHNIERHKSLINVLAICNIPLPSEVFLKQSYSINGSIPFVTFFKDRNASSKKYINKRNIKDFY